MMDSHSGGYLGNIEDTNQLIPMSLERGHHVLLREIQNHTSAHFIRERLDVTTPAYSNMNDGI